MNGKVTKLVKGFGSTWGRVRATGQTRDVFFNVASMIDSEDFQRLREGSPVMYEEEPERANGVIALNMSLIARKASAKSPPARVKTPIGEQA